MNADEWKLEIKSEVGLRVRKDKEVMESDRINISTSNGEFYILKKDLEPINFNINVNNSNILHNIKLIKKSELNDELDKVKYFLANCLFLINKIDNKNYLVRITEDTLESLITNLSLREIFGNGFYFFIGTENFKYEKGKIYHEDEFGNLSLCNIYQNPNLLIN